MIDNKIINHNDTVAVKKISQMKKTVLVGGCFDILHYGHVFFLKEARKLGSNLIVLLESDDFIRTYKKRQPVHLQEQRAEILSHLDMTDKIILLSLFETKDYSLLIAKIQPDVIAFTKGDPHLHQKKIHAETVGAQLVEIDLLAGFSSSNIIPYASVSCD
ncbi:MAG: adenylyltransferase/cytidyltransferase family protein [Patescibacteria group bacterium]